MLRGLDGKVGFLVDKMVEYCCAEEVQVRFKAAELTFKEVLPMLNRYTTTLHAINSAIIKLSKLTVAHKVYRGISGMGLPNEFWIHNECCPAPYPSSTVPPHRTPPPSDVGAAMPSSRPALHSRWQLPHCPTQRPILHPARSAALRSTLCPALLPVSSAAPPPRAPHRPLLRPAPCPQARAPGRPLPPLASHLSLPSNPPSSLTPELDSPAQRPSSMIHSLMADLAQWSSLVARA